MGRLDGKRALVTGGSSGIGAEIVRRFRREGAAVVLTGRDAARCRAVADEAGAGHVLADARSDADTARAVAEAVERLGGLDALVLNAGTGLVTPLIDTPIAEFQRILDVNVTGYLRYAQAAMPHLARAGGGAIVHIASDAGLIGEDEIGAYSVSKAAVIMLAKMLAVDGGRHGVRSNAICPGDIEPGMREMRAPGQPERLDDPAGWPRPPLGRIGRAEDVAGVAAFLASDDAAFCTGSIVLVDGGMRAGMRAGGRPTA